MEEKNNEEKIEKTTDVQARVTKKLLEVTS